VLLISPPFLRIVNKNSVNVVIFIEVFSNVVFVVFCQFFF
jgi:hypothetical protein